MEVSRHLSPTVADFRRRFLSFLADRYQAIAADPLTSDAFPTSFVPSAGPNLAVRALLEHGVPEIWNRVCVVQPCVRYWDLEQVGDHRHLSCFEMATFVSLQEDDRGRILGDLHDLLARGLGLDPERFWITVFAEGPVAGQEFPPDTEALDFWRALGIPEERLVPVAGTEGFVANRQEAVGGYRTEIYFETAPRCLGDCPECLPGKSECGRFVEVATSVTYAYAVDLDATPAVRPLDGTPVHAAGFGVERAVQVALGTADIAHVDTMARLRRAIEEICPAPADDPERERWATIAADHLKALAFLAADGASSLAGRTNKGRRWIVNRYTQSLRAAAAGLGLRGDSWLAEVLPVLVGIYDDPYPHLLARQDEIAAWLRSRLR